MTEGTPQPPQQPGQSAQPPGGYPPPQPPPTQAAPPAGGYPSPQTPPPQPPATGYPQQGYQQPGQATQYPQQSYPQPQQYPQQAQPHQPPKKSNVKKILLVLGLVIGLPLIGIGACTFFLLGAVTGPVDESNAMLALLDEGKYQEAYDSFDPTCTGDFGVEDIRAIWAGVEIDGYNLNDVSVQNSKADVSGTVSVNGGISNPISFELNKRDGDWKVCGFTVE